VPESSPSRPRIVLASSSTSRAALLRNAGIPCTQHPQNVDEPAIKAEMRPTGATVEAISRALARAKASVVSREVPQALVIGADQMLECGDEWLDKPMDRAEARQNLLQLKGRTHHLVTSAIVMLDDEELWSFTDRARLTMRDFSDAFLESYLKAAGDKALASVGAYQLEGLGAQLFESVEGDFFTILGLPLLPLLAFLRSEGALPG
jgi:septum formation protein